MGNPPYPMPTVVLFSFGTSSACGLVRAEVGPIYCPADSQIYVDPDFLGELSRRTTLSATSRKRIYSPVRSGITYKTRSARCRSSSAPCRRWTGPTAYPVTSAPRATGGLLHGCLGFLCPEAPSISSRRSRGRSAGCSKQLATSRRLALPHSKGGGSIGAQHLEIRGSATRSRSCNREHSCRTRCPGAMRAPERTKIA